MAAPRNEFWNYDFDLTLAANTTQNYTGAWFDGLSLPPPPFSCWRAMLL